MTTASILSRAAAGLDAPLITVEVHLTNGLPGLAIVGLPESSVREARERVRSALLSSHFDWPDRRITVSLAPADLPKTGGRFDLPIALGVLVASEQLPSSVTDGCEFYAELGLDGQLRPCPGLMTAVHAATGTGHICAVAASQAAALAALPNSRVRGANDLLTLCAQLKSPEPSFVAAPQADATLTAENARDKTVDLAHIHGQIGAKRGLEIAAAGGHHLLMAGPPGAGKTLLASVLTSILPDPDGDQQWQLRLMHDLRGDLDPTHIAKGPVAFRAPHHSITAAGLIGGGARALPGEISLAHAGVLFLDELPEFPRRILDLLRQPLETGQVLISRARHRCLYPARFQLVAAMNPCPCGLAGSAQGQCRCHPDSVARYQSRISGPLLDRIDIHLTLERQETAALLDDQAPVEGSGVVRARVIDARQRQIRRQRCLNRDLNSDGLRAYCQLTPAVRRWLAQAGDRLQLSARAIHGCLRVARSIADIDGLDAINEQAIMEALGYRPRLGED